MANTRKPDVVLPKMDSTYESPMKDFLKLMFFYKASVNPSPISEKDLMSLSNRK